MSEPEGTPTIILVGGTMTMSDGSVLDSRQPTELENQAQAMRKALTKSWLWWSTVSSLVLPILEGYEPERFALLVGERTVIELATDGTLKRRRLAKLLPGGGSNIKTIWSPTPETLPDGWKQASEVGYEPLQGEAKWRFVLADYQVQYLVQELNPAVIVVTDESHLADSPYPLHWESYSYLKTLASSSDSLVILPHTARTEAVVENYLHWSRRERPEMLPLNPEPTPYDPDAPPELERFLQPVVVAADFGVTGLVENGEWRDPADLEAARRLRQARYDLQIGIWDLARNPVLRSTLLESAPVAPAPAAPAVLPSDAVERTNQRVAGIVAKRAHDKAMHGKNWPEIKQTLLRSLEPLGWVATPGRQYDENLDLGLTEPLRIWVEGDDRPLVTLRLVVSRDGTELHARTPMHGEARIDEYVQQPARLPEFEKLAADNLNPKKLNADDVVVWTAAGGWGDDSCNIDWNEVALAIAERTPRWTDLFHDLTEIYREARPRHFSSRGPLAVAYVSYRPDDIRRG